MSARRRLSLLGLWTAARIRLFLRTPRAAFFTFVFPLLLLVLINATNSGTVTGVSGKVPFAAYFTPSLAIFGLITACFTGTVFTVATARDRGIFKRIQGTPLPAGVYLGSWTVSSVITGVASVILLVIVGMLAFDVSIEPRLIPAALVSLILGGLALSAMGLAVASFVAKAESAPVVANITMFPLLFLSGVFFPIHDAAQWIQDVANIFPVAHLVDAFTACFDPNTTGTGFSNDFWSLVLWIGIGGAIAVRRYRVEMSVAGGDRHTAVATAG